MTQQYVFNPKNWVSLDYVDDRKIAQIAGATARARTWSSPTLNVFNKAFADRETDEEIRSRPDWNMMPPGLRAGYLQARERYWSAANAVERTEARRKRYVDVRNRLVKAIHDSGGKILAGSDTPEWFHAYGWGLHRELQALVEAGLTPYEALAAATRNPAEFLDQSSEWGTLEPGTRADLVLLDANPLEDIGNTMKIAAVGDRRALARARGAGSHDRRRHARDRWRRAVTALLLGRGLRGNEREAFSLRISFCGERHDTRRQPVRPVGS